MTKLQNIALAASLWLTSSVAFAQSSDAGNAVAEQLAQSSIRMIGSLVAVLALLAACSWGLRRWRDRRSVSSEAIEIVSGISLGSKERIVLLRIGTEQVLVGVSPAGMRRLHVIKPGRSLKQLEAVTAHSEVDSEADSDLTLSKKPVPAAFDLSMGAAQ